MDQTLVVNPFARLWALIRGAVWFGNLLSGWYEKVAAVVLLIAVVEAVWFAIKHYRRIRDFKKGWRQRMAPAHMSWITKRSGIMCMIEPIMVFVVIILCGLCVAIVWPCWVPIVSLTSIYDLIHYGNRKVKKWRGKLPPESFGFNKVKDFPWIYGDYDADVVNSISVEAMSKRKTRNGARQPTHTKHH